MAPIARIIFRPIITGTENIPRSGRVILASNHLSFADSMVIPFVVPRKVVFLAKSDYFTGTGALTHRCVAKKAQVPLAATTYYFASRDDLIAETFFYLAEKEMQQLELGILEIPESLSADFVAGWWANLFSKDFQHRRRDILAEYEMHLETSRRRDLLAIHRKWDDTARRFFLACMRAIGSKHPQIDADIVLSTLVGIQIKEIADSHPHLEADILRPILQRLLSALCEGQKIPP